MIRAWIAATMLACTMLASAKAEMEVEEILDVAYGPHERQRLDLYVPKHPTGPRPVVLWIHGGGWREGDKRDGVNRIGDDVAAMLVERGYVAAACNYRLLPEHRHPAQVEDVWRVVRWLRANAEKYQIDPDRVGVVGISAGAHLASMLAVRDEQSDASDELAKYSSRPQAAVAINGPYDLRSDPEISPKAVSDAVAQFIGTDVASPEKAIADASPIQHVSKGDAPLMLIVGADDPLVPPAQSKQMAAELEKHGVETELVGLEGVGHGAFLWNTPAAREAAFRFFDKHLKPDRAR